MHIGRSRLAGRPIVAAVVVSLAALTSAAFVAPATAQGTCNTGSAPAVYPENQLQPGTMATGLTTIQGRTPQSFDAKVLGILPNAILPGHDIILVKISGPVVDQTGGGFFGMSGSPVSIGDQLVGAVAYGPPGGYGDQTIMGLTPAQDMVDVLSYQDSTSPQAGASRAARLSPSTRARVARVAGESASQVPNQLVRLKLPFAVSGLNGRAMSKLRRYVKQLGLSVVLYRSAPPPSSGGASTQPLEPGGPVSAVISSGDVTAGAIGTVTATCGDNVLLFGHPFFFDGQSTMGLNGANVLTVVRDQSQLFGSYMVATIAEPHGTIDQDRFSAVRGIEGPLPPSASVTANVTNPDTGRTRSGETDFLKQSIGSSSIFSFLGPFAVVAEQDTAFDQIGAGSDSVAWTLTGTTAEGKQFTLSRADTTWSPYDASFQGIIDMLNALGLVANNRFTEVTFTGLHADSTITHQQLTEKITGAAISTPENPAFSTKRRVRVNPGDRIRVRVTMLPYGSTTPQTRTVSVMIPAGNRGGGELLVRGGGSQAGFFGGGGLRAKTFDDLLAKIQGLEHDTDLVVQLLTPGTGRQGNKQTVSGTRVVLGRRVFFIDTGGPIVCGGGAVGKPGPTPSPTPKPKPC